MLRKGFVPLKEHYLQSMAYLPVLAETKSSKNGLPATSDRLLKSFTFPGLYFLDIHTQKCSPHHLYSILIRHGYKPDPGYLASLRKIMCRFMSF